MIICGNALHLPLKDNTVQCCVTSPPYYGLRDYGTAKWQGGDPNCDHIQGLDNPRSSRPLGKFHGGDDKYITTPYKDICGKCGAIRIDDQIGLEPTPDEYVAKLVQVFREVKRVLKDDGVLWLNLGDSYASLKSRYNQKAQSLNGGKSQDNEFHGNKTDLYHHKDLGFKDKDLLGIPWMVAFALRADGWYLRSDIIWSKPNPMPESVKDRPTKAHEYIFLLAKAQRYYYDNEAILEVATGYDGRKDTMFKGAVKSYDGVMPNGQPQSFAQNGHERWKYKNLQADGQQPNTMHLNRLEGEEYLSPVRNKRSVWVVNTQPFKGAHFAVMPEKLVEPCVLAGTRQGDIVLDPFAGSGTVGVVAQKLGRGFVGIELNPEYVKLAEARLLATPQSLFNFSEVLL